MNKISVIIPCYNNEKYIKKCLDSIANQTFQNFEAIIVNDGSTDNTKSIIEEYAKNNSKFKVINQPNSGVSAARNKGIDVASSEYICFADGDDFVDKNYFNKMIEAIESTKSDLCICSVIHEELNGKLILIDKMKNEICSNIELANKKNLIWGYATNKLYKLSIIKANQLKFAEDVKFAEDELFYLNYLFLISQVVLIEDCLYHYVRQKASATMDKTNMSVQTNRFYSRNLIIDLLKNNGISQYVIDKHRIGAIDTCLLILAFKFKGEKLTKNQKNQYLKYIKNNKEIYLKNKDINWKAKFYLKLACFSLFLYIPIRRAQLKLTHRI